MAADSENEGNPQNYLAESLKRFCRSIELSDDYLRGYYGLKRVGGLKTVCKVGLLTLETGHR